MNYDLISDDDIEAQMNPRVAVPDAEAYIADYVERSAEVRSRLNGRLDVSYGDTPLQGLDVFPAPDNARAPIHIFMHGGYWRALDKSANSFIADALVRAGATTILLNYDLCPAVTLDDIVDQIIKAIAWVHKNAAELGGDPNRIYVSGHSAGGQLAMMALAHDWENDGLPADLIKGVVGVSGVYELSPLLRTSVNDDVRLTEDMAARNSPTLHPPTSTAPMVIAVGQQEPEAFIAQSKDFHQVCVDRGFDSQYLECPGDDHFSILYSLANPISGLCGLVLRQMSLA